MKNRKLLSFTGAIAALCLAYSVKMPVYAGDINAAEQMVIDFYNGTFSYEGKTYVATEEAKASVYAKLAQDGVDLTEQEAKTAIRQASAQVGDGVEQGYLTEAAGSGNTGAENEKDAANGTNDGKDKEQGTAGKSENGGKSENRGTAGNRGDTGNGGKSENSGTAGNSGESENSGNAGNNGKSETGGTAGAGNKADSGTETGGRTGAGSGTDSSKGQTGSGPDNGNGNSSGGEGQGELPEPFRKIDLSQLLEEAGKEGGDYVQITPGEDFTITVEQYLQGKLTAVSQEGFVLFEGGLPLKNTGYTTGSWKWPVLIMTAGLCAAFGAALWILRQENNGWRNLSCDFKAALWILRQEQNNGWRNLSCDFRAALWILRQEQNREADGPAKVCGTTEKVNQGGKTE